MACHTPRGALLMVTSFRLEALASTPLLLCAPPRYLIEVAHVAVVPGDAFGAPDCVRISYATSLPQLDEALRRIAHALSPKVFTRRAS